MLDGSKPPSLESRGPLAEQGANIEAMKRQPAPAPAPARSTVAALGVPNDAPVAAGEASESTVSGEQVPLASLSQSGGDAPGVSSQGKSRPGLGPRRSLGLGDDFALAHALSQQENLPNRTAVASENLRRSLRQDQADNDRPLGLNVPAPLILALESAARELAIPTNAVAVFTANIDGTGHLLGLEFNHSNHASPQWAKLSERVEQALSGRKLSIAKNTKGVDLKLRLVARVTLPSGADPGLGVSVLGLPVKKGQGKRSPKITILDPTPQMLEMEIPGASGEEKIKIPIPGLVFNVLSIAGDPADIGAPARQMVRVEIIDEKVY